MVESDCFQSLDDFEDGSKLGANQGQMKMQKVLEDHREEIKKLHHHVEDHMDDRAEQHHSVEQDSK